MLGWGLSPSSFIGSGAPNAVSLISTIAAAVATVVTPGVEPAHAAIRPAVASAATVAVAPSHIEASDSVIRQASARLATRALVDSGRIGTIQSASAHAVAASIFARRGTFVSLTPAIAELVTVPWSLPGPGLSVLVPHIPTQPTASFGSGLGWGMVAYSYAGDGAPLTTLLLNPPPTAGLVTVTTQSLVAAPPLTKPATMQAVAGSLSVGTGRQAGITPATAEVVAVPWVAPGPGLSVLVPHVATPASGVFGNGLGWGYIGAGYIAEGAVFDTRDAAPAASVASLRTVSIVAAPTFVSPATAGLVTRALSNLQTIGDFTIDSRVWLGRYTSAKVWRIKPIGARPVPALKDEVFELGETWNVIVYANDADGRPLADIGTSTIEWMIGDPATKHRLLLVSSPSIIVLDAPSAKVGIQVTPAAQRLALLPAGDFAHILRITEPNGTVTHQVEGRIRIRPDPFATYT